MIGLTFICFGFFNTDPLIRILLGAKWASTEVPSLLSWYCCYILVIGINGITEAFVYSVAPAAQIERLNRLLIVFSVCYTALAVILVNHIGNTGLILANGINMIMRIAVSVRFINTVFRENRGQAPNWGKVLPHRTVLAAFLGALGVSSITYRVFYLSGVWQYAVLHVGITAAFFVVVAGLVWVYERTFVRQLRSIISTREIAVEIKKD